MVFGTPGETAAAFEKLEWVVLYQGPIGGAKSLLEKLRSAELYDKVEIPEDRASGSTEVVVSGPVPLLDRAREVLAEDPPRTSS
jgi:hypothetical protein